MKKVGDKVIKGAIDYNQFTIQIYTHTSFILMFISIWMIVLGLLSAVLGGILPNIQCERLDSLVILYNE